MPVPPALENDASVRLFRIETFPSMNQMKTIKKGNRRADKSYFIKQVNWL